MKKKSYSNIDSFLAWKSIKKGLPVLFVSFLFMIDSMLGFLNGVTPVQANPGKNYTPSKKTNSAQTNSQDIVPFEHKLVVQKQEERRSEKMKGIDEFTPVKTHEAILNILFDSFHVLPPLGEHFSGKKECDKTLHNYLKVSVREPIDEDSFIVIEEFIAAPGNKIEGGITLQNWQYHINWQIDKELRGKILEVHFEVAGLELGFFEHKVHSCRTLPIKFLIENDPRLRARILHEQGYTATETAIALKEEFDITAADAVLYLSREEYDILAIGEALRDVFSTLPEEAAQLLKEVGFYSAIEVAQVLKSVFALEDDAITVAQILKDTGYSASQIYDVLFIEFSLEVADIVDILEAIGFTADELFAAVSRQLAEKFAPQLRYDKSANTFPMSAQDYYDQIIATDAWLEPFAPLQNNDITTLTTDGLIPPTYFKAFQCGQQIRILYWFFYGWQDRCLVLNEDTTGLHHGDWESVLVTISEDKTQLAAVTFFQHSGHYTRLAEGGDSDRFMGASYGPGFSKFETTHPIVYVGRNQHGSYHFSGGSGDMLRDIPYCFYYADYRHNEGRVDLWLDSWKNLVSLADYEEPWMEEDEIGGFVWGWDGDCSSGTSCPDSDLSGVSTHPVQKSTPEKYCYLDTCDGFDSTIFGVKRGCFESQCEYHDNQSWWTDLHPGTCSHCPPGYTDMGTSCTKWWGPFPIDIISIHYYGLEYTIPTTDAGLVHSQW